MSKEQNPEMPVRFYRTEAGGSPVLDWRQGRPPRYRARPHAGAVRLADWEATGGKPQRWSLGSALVASEPADSPAHPVLSRRDSRRAARVYQENAENARG